jgi:hypothetical protein
MSKEGTALLASLYSRFCLLGVLPFPATFVLPFPSSSKHSLPQKSSKLVTIFPKLRRKVKVDHPQVRNLSNGGVHYLFKLLCELSYWMGLESLWQNLILPARD